MATLVTLLVILGTAVILGLIYFFLHFKTRRRATLASVPLTPEQLNLLESNVPQTRNLPSPQRAKLEGLLQVFLHEKRFEACGELPAITDEIRITIAGNACLLLCGMKNNNPYPRLRSVLVYPAAYTRSNADFDEDLDLVLEKENAIILGESWDTGSVILSWADVETSIRTPADGFNLVLHEFAHQLDSLSGEANGAPPLPTTSSYRTWTETFTEAFHRHTRRLESGLPLLLDEYAATAPEEFFAVATETFFELPIDLQAEYPDLYLQLKSFYRLDPAAW